MTNEPTRQPQDPLVGATIRDGRQVYEDEQERKRQQFEANQEAKRQAFEERLELQKALRDWMMLVITIAAVLAAYWTGYEARHARIEAAEAAKESLKAQNSAVDNQIAAMRLEQRPFVKIDAVTEEIDLDSYAAHIRFHFFGNTPAFAIRVRTTCDGPASPYQTLASSETNLPSADPETQVEAYSMCIKVQEVDHIPDVKFTGNIEYRDFFQVTHHSTFCYFASYDQFHDTGKQSLQMYPCRDFVPEATGFWPGDLELFKGFRTS